MLIFLDSSIFCSDFYQSSINFELLKNFISKGGGWLCLSEIVIEEVKNKYKEKITAQIQKINNEIRELSKQVCTVIPVISEEYIEKELKKYSDFWDILLFEYGNSQPEGYPSVSHQEVIQRALQRKKPFKEDGKDGYRDFLIWKTFLEVVRSYSMEQACFITLNTRDFSDPVKKDGLHSQLKQDIQALKIELSRVSYFSSLKDFVEERIKPELQAITEREKLVHELKENQKGFITPLENALVEKLKGIDLSRYLIFDIENAEDPTISEIEGFSEVEIENVSEVNTTEYLLNIKVQILCNIQFCIHKSDYLVMEDVSQISIIDSDWNKHYVLAETPMEIEISLEAIYTKDYEQIRSIDIENIENPYEDCIYCP